jgi:hypothetical protein
MTNDPQKASPCSRRRDRVRCNPRLDRGLREKQKATNARGRDQIVKTVTADNKRNQREHEATTTDHLSVSHPRHVHNSSLFIFIQP